MVEGAKHPKIAARKFKAPDLPPGVVPKNPDAGYMALDSNLNQQLFDWCNSGNSFCGIAFPGYQYLAQLTQRSEYRAPSETLAQEMTRMGVQLETTGEEDLGDEITELTQDLLDYNIVAMLRQCSEIDGFFGRSQVYIDIKGQDGDNKRKMPLMVNDSAGIRVGSLNGFKVIEPTWTTPYAYNSIDPTKPDFYKPQAWYVLGKQTHASRLLTFIGRQVPDLLKPAYNFSGLSLSQLMEPYVIRWLATVDGVNRIINNFSILALLTNLQATLSNDQGGELIKRAQLFQLHRNNQGLMLLDKESEELAQIAVPLSGLSELQAQAQEHMAAPAHMPLVKLTGITPSGLNASSEGEIQVFYDYVKGMQELFFRPNLTTIINILQLNRYGKINPHITHSYVPLDQMNGKELSEVRKSDADAGVAYINSGVISADEERERIQRDPESGYNHLKGAAPEPPDLTGMEVQHQLGEESADKAHQRGEESADNAHERAKELTDKSDKG